MLMRCWVVKRLIRFCRCSLVFPTFPTPSPLCLFHYFLKIFAFMLCLLSYSQVQAAEYLNAIPEIAVNHIASLSLCVCVCVCSFPTSMQMEAPLIWCRWPSSNYWQPQPGKTSPTAATSLWRGTTAPATATARRCASWVPTTRRCLMTTTLTSRPSQMDAR